MIATAETVNLIVDTKAAQIPATASEAGRPALLGTIGMTLAGLSESSAQAARDLITVDEGGRGAGDRA